jgi:23S rRNA (cytidine1920-2'-O)/16S rRNA (cytidine1409-2'-O)-methyltransferase
VTDGPGQRSPKPGKERLDKLVVDRGLAPSRERARSLILAGKVLVAGRAVDKAGEAVAVDCELSLREEDHPYVSRGALKLVRGLDHFGVDPAGRVAIDVGASTGGFTDVLLRRGATRVYAVDVGYGQLEFRLRGDARVVVLERENIRHLDPARIAEPLDLAVCDVSFISLTLVLPKLRELLAGPGKPAIVLVKPQFEVGKGEVGRGGVVRDEAKRRAAVAKIVDFATHSGWRSLGDVESPITGPAGNVEYLLHLETA